MCLIEWPANILPTRIPQGVFEEFQEEIPLATREELRSNNHSQGLTEDFDRPAWTSTLASWSRLPGRRCERVGHADTAATKELIRGPQWLVLMPALSIEQESDKPRRIDDAERA